MAVSENEVTRRVLVGQNEKVLYFNGSTWPPTGLSEDIGFTCRSNVYNLCARVGKLSSSNYASEPILRATQAWTAT